MKSGGRSGFGYLARYNPAGATRSARTPGTGRKLVCQTRRPPRTAGPVLGPGRHQPRVAVLGRSESDPNPEPGRVVGPAKVRCPPGLSFSNSRFRLGDCKNTGRGPRHRTPAAYPIILVYFLSVNAPNRTPGARGVVPYRNRLDSTKRVAGDSRNTSGCSSWMIS